MNIEEQAISYNDVSEGILIENDDLGIAAYALASPRKEAFLNNPNIKDGTKCMLLLMRVGGCVAGRMMFFPSRFYNGEEICESWGGSSLEVHNNYRNTDVGSDLALYPVCQKSNNLLIYSDFSKEGLAACSSLKFDIFRIPKYYYFKHHYALFANWGMTGVAGRLLGKMVDGIIASYRMMATIFDPSISDFAVEKVSKIPRWVDSVVMNDGHKYMEVHDHQWFQWNLDNKFHNDEGNQNDFYIVKKKGANVGFFMTKTRRRKKNCNVDLLAGCIMEWGSVDQSVLSDYQIFRLALKSINGAVDYVAMAIEDCDLQNKMKKQIIIRRGDHAIAIKDLRKRYKDIKNQSLWRLRYGYADSILN